MGAVGGEAHHVVRREFVKLAGEEGAKSGSCAGGTAVSPDGYKWLARYRAEGEAGSRIGRGGRERSPGRTPAAIEAAVLACARSTAPGAGARSGARLQRLRQRAVPAPSTITAILRRHGQHRGAASAHPGPSRFEQAAPNELWQMDFKGHFATGAGALPSADRARRPLALYLGLAACGDERAATVQARADGDLPPLRPARCAMLMDNGSPWGDCAATSRTGSRSG